MNASSAATADVLAAAAFDDTEPDVLPAGDTAKQERLREVEARLGHSLPLDRLDPETAGLLDRRFGLSTGTPSSLHEEADRLGMDPIDVRRREAEALRSLRDLHTSA